MRSADTPPGAHERQIEILRSMSPSRRFETAVEISETVVALAADGIRARHPDYDEPQVTWALRRLRLGDHLFRLVWPGAPLVAP